MSKHKWKKPPVTKFRVPTYFGGPEINDDGTYGADHKKEFDKPMAEIGVYKADGLTVELGKQPKEGEPPNVVFERRLNGWMIVLHPVGGGDASAIVYFLDDGRSFIEKGCGIDCPENIVMVDNGPEELDEPKQKEVTA